MDWPSNGCPIWIDPGNAFRLVVKVPKYVADGEYGLLEITDQEHELWVDTSQEYSVAKFNDDMASKIIWGPSQTLAVWVVDADTLSEWKIRRDEHFQQLIKDRYNDRLAVLVVEVVSKHDHTANATSSVRSCSGVTSEHGSGVAAAGQGKQGTGNAESSGVNVNVEGSGDTCSSPPPVVADEAVEVDWAELTILQQASDDGEAKEAADEARVYEAMGFKAADERAEEAARESVPIPTMTAEMQEDMAEAEVPVDDHVDLEPMFDWDRDNPDMTVGVSYPCMTDFRLAVRERAPREREAKWAASHSPGAGMVICHAPDTRS
ncbi:unnamed protein product [Urochloa decumbens]|uniref:Uncharacterized protein n=1 Tax=Urochloa decumbens TaxID=240449 RepID=A0ABC8VQV0_9POAL